MARVETKLTPTANGGFTARKRIPADVRDVFRDGKPQREAWFNSGPVPIGLARAKHREWLNEIEGRIANLRAARKGEGQTLTPMQARALSGEWYRWYIARHHARPQSAEHWEFFRDQINEALTDALGHLRNPRDPERREIDDVWQLSEARAEIRPMLADWCETTQFLAAQRVALDNASRDLFLDALYEDFGVALKLLIRQAHGDYTPDTWPLRFPSLQLQQRHPVADQSPWKLFEAWTTARKPAAATIGRWRAVFIDLEAKFAGPNYEEPLNEDTAQAWAREKVTAERTAATVKDVWVNAANTVYAWAKGQRLVSSNPFAEVTVTVPRKIRTRENKAFTADEAKIILRAAMSFADTKRPSDGAKRWVPWLCAYSGARVGEITQLATAREVR